MFNLLRYFSLASAVAFAVITVVLVYHSRQSELNGLVESAQSQNVTLARSFANVIWPRFSHYVASVSGMDGDTLRARPETRELDAALKMLTTGLPVLKVKIYDLDGLTVYSSQPSQMGADKSNNLGFLKSAQDGIPASKLSFRDTFSAFSGTVENRDLVESYLPIWASDGAIEGVFELYTDVTPLMASVERHTTEFTAGLLLSFGLLYGVLILIVRHADRILGRQYSELNQAEEALGRARDVLETRVLERTNELRSEITERKRTEQALQDSEERFRSVVDNSPAKIHIKDVEGRYTLVNSEAEKLFGVTEEEAKGKTTHEIFPDSQADDFRAHDQAVLETGQVIEQEEQWESDDGVHTYLTVKFPIRDGDGEIVAIGAIGTDITERKRTEQALRDSENRFQGFAEIGSDWMWEMDADLRFSYFSDPIHKISGVPREHYFGKTRLEVGQGSIDDEDWHQHLADLEAHRPFRDFCYTYIKPNGQWYYCSVSGDPMFDSSGIFTGYRGIGSDITERKRAEEALRESEVRLAKTAKMARVGYWVWDEIEDKAIYCSDELAEINGVATGRELAAILNSSEKDLEWVHPGDRDHVAKAVRASMAERRGYDIEFRMIRRDGEVRHLREILEPVYDDEGNLVRSKGIIQDITDRKHAEDQLRQAQKMEAVGQLTGGLAHDFNNLLGVILGNAEMVADRLGEDDKQVGAIVHAATRGAELTQRLLSFSRQQALNPQTVDLNACVAGMTDMLRRTLEEHIDIEAVTAAGLWNCEVDPAQLENALVNLALNARDAMPDGGKLTIETANARLDDDYAAAQADVTPGRYVMLAVTDTGWDAAGGSGACFRAVLHDQGDRQGLGPGPLHGLRLRQAVGRACRDLQ